MELSVVPTGDIPIYRQLYDQLSAQILRGDLPPGTPLPPIRRLAAELSISVITVRRTWEELERDGFIVTSVGRGTVVADHPPGGLDSRRLEAAREKLREDLEYYRALGLTREELLELVKEIF